MALSQRSRTVLTLYSARDCIHCHRVRLVLAAKGVTYDLVPVDLDDPPEDLLDLNPYNSVPTLVDRDLVLYDTSVICEYLDERYPHPPLMPVDPLSRARLRLAIVRIENDWLTLVDQIEAGGRTGRHGAQDAARRADQECVGVQGVEVLPEPRDEPRRLRACAADLAPRRARRAAAEAKRT